MTKPTLYALAKQVPAMLGGFTIATSYGDIDICDPDECQAVATVVRALLEQRLAGGAPESEALSRPAIEFGDDLEQLERRMDDIDIEELEQLLTEIDEQCLADIDDLPRISGGHDDADS